MISARGANGSVPSSRRILPARSSAPVRGRNNIATTLDLGLAADARRPHRQLHRYTNALSGVTNAAAMLVDTRGMQVLAQVGSADFALASIHGQVDCTASPRSPGSTLKPFIYALALEQGLIHPLSILEDAPRSFGSYNPENFDREFAGPIRATDALARSRNIPAITLASQLARPNLYEFLRGAGIDLPARRAILRPRPPAGRRGSDHAGPRQTLRRAGERRHVATPRLSISTLPPRPSSEYSVPEASFLTLEMLRTARPEIADTGQPTRSSGRPAPPMATATHGPSRSSIITSWPSGWAMPMAAATPHSSAGRAPLRSFSRPSTACAPPAMYTSARTTRRLART